MAAHSKPEKSPTDIDGVAKEWDGYEDIRDRLRGTQFEEGSKSKEDVDQKVQILGDKAFCQDISTCVQQRSFLEPLLSKMALNTKRTVPGIDQLKDEVQSLLKINKRGTDSDWDQVSKAAWCLRKLCGFVKMKCRRREVSGATRLNSVIRKL